MAIGEIVDLPTSETKSQAPIVLFVREFVPCQNSEGRIIFFHKPLPVKFTRVPLVQYSGLAPRIVSMGDMFQCLPTVCDVIFSRLYYSDCGHRRHVGVCDLAGTGCAVPAAFDAPSVGCVSSIVVDVAQNRVYWTDVDLSVISSASLSGDGLVRIR